MTEDRIRQDHSNPGWWKATVCVDGEVRDGWAMSEREAVEVAGGLRANMEQEQRRAKEGK